MPTPPLPSRPLAACAGRPRQPAGHGIWHGGRRDEAGASPALAAPPPGREEGETADGRLHREAGRWGVGGPEDEPLGRNPLTVRVTLRTRPGGCGEAPAIPSSSSSSLCLLRPRLVSVARLPTRLAAVAPSAPPLCLCTNPRTRARTRPLPTANGSSVPVLRPLVRRPTLFSLILCPPTVCFALWRCRVSHESSTRPNGRSAARPDSCAFVNAPAASSS
ncbi:hypothetical protein CDD83_4064 [Cordyceps sp. RAO-2017]|nr:hypothetical protein CDD83_4064 [Cordyceps sp. RAO-2017]